MADVASLPAQTMDSDLKAELAGEPQRVEQHEGGTDEPAGVYPLSRVAVKAGCCLPSQVCQALPC